MGKYLRLANLIVILSILLTACAPAAVPSEAPQEAPPPMRILPALPSRPTWPPTRN